ncbi:MAG TPA: hypothetical protein VD963_02880 [Phycisphaerales bacterium]|nr:hypothetical protein [Phycisphaerales bacterium]
MAARNIAGRSARGYPRLISPGRCATLLAILALGLCLAPGSARGAHGAAGGPEPVAALGPAAAFAAYRAVERVVRGWDDPESLRGELPAVPGCSVQLRYGGRLAGRGTAMTAGTAAEPSSAVIITALRAAMGEVEERLPVPNDLLAEEHRRERSANLAISVEFAGPAVAVRALTYAQAESELAWGLDGVAVSAGERVEAVFPAMMLVTGTPPARAISAAASALLGGGEGVSEPRDLASRHGAKVWRMRTTHLAQATPRAEPVFLHRGGRLARLEEMDRAGLREFAGGLAAHLSAHAPRAGAAAWAGDVYDPVRDALAPSDPVLSAAVAVLALRGHLALMGDADPESDRIGEAVRAYEQELRRGARARRGDPLALAALGVADVNEADIAGGLEGAYSEATGFAETVPEGARGFVALALVARGAPGAESAVRRVYRETPPGRLVGQMPWLGLAELRLADRGKTPGARAHVAADVALRHMRAHVWDHQVGQIAAGSDHPDLVGGIVFTASPGREPSWHGAKPVAFLAMMVRDDRLTDPGERHGELARLLSSVRFLRQLAADEAACWMYADPELAMGGVRGSAWDQTMRSEATSLTLLAVCETIRSLDALAGRRGVEVGGGTGGRGTPGAPKP